MRRAVFILASVLFFSTTALVAADKCAKSIKQVVVVDGLSSGTYLAKEIRKQGGEPLHLMSSPKPTDILKSSYHPEDFAEEFKIGVDGNFSDALKWIKSQPNVVGILTGAETGTMLAHEMSRSYSGFWRRLFRKMKNGVRYNTGPANVLRYKSAQQATLKAHGLRYKLNTQVKTPEDAIKWINANDLWKKGVVLKPTAGGASEGVTPCFNEQMVRDAFKIVFGQTNVCNIVNDCVQVEELIPGDAEYVVNMVSLDGHHVATDLWKYTKEMAPGVGFLYKIDRLLPSNVAVRPVLESYLFKVLEAFKVKNGFTHTEIKVDDRGPVLIELANRMMGSGIVDLVERATGKNQVTLGVQSVLHSEEFLKLDSNYTLNKHVVVFTLSTQKASSFSNLVMKELLANVPGILSVKFYHGKAELQKTRDLETAVGHIEIVHESEESVQKVTDYMTQLERQGLFEIQKLLKN